MFFNKFQKENILFQIIISFIRLIRTTKTKSVQYD